MGNGCRQRVSLLHAIENIFLIVPRAYCLWENKARREGRREENITQYQALRNAGKTRAPIGDRDPRFLFTL